MVFLGRGGATEGLWAFCFGMFTDRFGVSILVVVVVRSLGVKCVLVLALILVLQWWSGLMVGILRIRWYLGMVILRRW